MSAWNGVYAEPNIPDFDTWIDALTDDVIEDEYGYEPGEFTVYPEAWRWAFDEGLTPKQAFDRALKAASDAREEREAERLANYERIKAEDAALTAALKEGPDAYTKRMASTSGPEPGPGPDNFAAPAKGSE